MRQRINAGLVLGLLIVSLAGLPTFGFNEAAAGYFGNTKLVDQTGTEHEFFRDLMAGKIVVINAFFTSCDGVCPVLTKKLVAIQDELGERLGESAHILSISVDPETDTVDRLADYAEIWGAKPGWYFLSGPPESVEDVLSRLGQYVEEPTAHSPIVLIGNVETGLWKKGNGLAPAGDLVEIVRSVVEDSL